MLRDYHLTAELTGEGPYKLHRARRRADALPVLIKVPRHEPARQSDVAGLEHEFKLLELLPRESTRLLVLERGDGRSALVFRDAGGVLLSTLCQSAPPDLAASLAIAMRLAAALAELHRRNIIHGGINPQGILVDPHDWRIQLIDFSSARRAIAEQHADSLPNLPPGRLMYISPEQTGRMNRAVDYRADFYSLGVCLYQLLTGACPFRADDPLETVHAHIEKMPAAPSAINPDIPAVLDQLVLKLLAKSADERYQSALGLRADLERCAHEWARRGDIPAFPLGSIEIVGATSRRDPSRPNQDRCLLSRF